MDELQKMKEDAKKQRIMDYSTPLKELRKRISDLVGYLTPERKFVLFPFKTNFKGGKQITIPVPYPKVVLKYHYAPNHCYICGKSVLGEYSASQIPTANWTDDWGRHTILNSSICKSHYNASIELFLLRRIYDDRIYLENGGQVHDVKALDKWYFYWYVKIHGDFDECSKCLFNGVTMCNDCVNKEDKIMMDMKKFFLNRMEK